MKVYLLIFCSYDCLIVHYKCQMAYWNSLISLTTDVDILASSWPSLCLKYLIKIPFKRTVLETFRLNTFLDFMEFLPAFQNTVLYVGHHLCFSVYMLFRVWGSSSLMVRVSSSVSAGQAVPGQPSGFTLTAMRMAPRKSMQTHR